MKAGLRSELSFFTGLAALAFLWKGRPRLAASLAVATVALKTSFNSAAFFRNRCGGITGGSRGVGFALAGQMVKVGAKVTLLARDREELNSAAEKLNGYAKHPVLTIECDVTHRGQLKSAFQRVLDHFGDIDTLINNAGSVVAGPFQSMTQADFETQMNLHFFAVLKAVQTVLPHFKARGEGRIVNISSIGGKIPVPHMSTYCASKFALTGFSQALSAELQASDIHVTTVCPGLMRTGSPIQGVFKGDVEKEYAWFALSDSMPGLSISATNAARQILDAVRMQRSQAVISWPAKMGVFAHTNFPEISQAFMALANRFLPQGQSQIRKTGADSKSWLESQIWARPFNRILHRAQKKFNEHEKSDAEFNMNLSPGK